MSTTLSEASSRVGQTAQEAGVNFDELAALVTAAEHRTARGGVVIGNALKSIFTRIQRDEILDQLKSYNITVRDEKGLLPAIQILKNFASACKDLSDSQRNHLCEQVAGVYQLNMLKVILLDLN